MQEKKNKKTKNKKKKPVKYARNKKNPWKICFNIKKKAENYY